MQLLLFIKPKLLKIVFFCVLFNYSAKLVLVKWKLWSTDLSLGRVGDIVFWGFGASGKLPVPCSVSQVSDLLLEKDLHFHGIFLPFQHPDLESCHAPSSSKLHLWCHRFIIFHPERPRLQQIPLRPTDPNHSCSLACLDAPWTSGAFAFLHPPWATSPILHPAAPSPSGQAARGFW